ncbi:hypothetical protein [Nocardioides sp. Leaf285]|uniref:hypothetical protein n=1 Tax=Nocardioides sp. Leaf285 TaxID=1736322 RepID=UPI000AA23E58|nr:hypothetical protein [Nocardioides sp. Leaf285]
MRESADGHVLIQGARWHYPRQGDPTACAVTGCGRILGQQGSSDTEDAPDEEAST